MTEYTQYRVGIGNVGAYQVSAVPYLSSSIIATASAGTPKQIDFPTVTSFLMVRNDGTAKLRVGFSANGVKTLKNYFTLPASGSISGDWKVRSVFLLSDAAATNTTASVVAGLTCINVREIVNRNNDRQNWSGSVGIG